MGVQRKMTNSKEPNISPVMVLLAPFSFAWNIEEKECKAKWFLYGCNKYIKILIENLIHKYVVVLATILKKLQVSFP